MNNFFIKLDAFFKKEIKFNNKIKRKGDFVFKINLNIPDNTKIYYWAANPPIYNSSYSGSGLPYVNPNIAFQNTPNTGIIYSKGRLFETHLYFPSAFYGMMGSLFIEPTIFFKINSLDSKLFYVNIKNSIPYRQCVNIPYKYFQPINNNDINTVLTQENIIRSKSYPAKNIDTF